MASFGPAKLPALFSTKDVQSSFATILVYSMPRFGKTNLIRTLLPHGFRPLILATDQGDSHGLQTISDLDIPCIPIKTWEEAVMVFAELNKPRPNGKPSYQGYEFDVLVNDSLSGFGDIWMTKGLDALGWNEVGIAAPGHDPRRIYAYIPEKGRQTAKALMAVQSHLILICRETMAEEGEGKERITYPVPELPGAKLPRELPGWLDGVVFGKVQGVGENAKRLFLTQAEGKTVAGVRAPEGRRLPKLVEANYGLLIKYMMGDDDAFRAMGGKPPSLILPKEATALPTVASTSTANQE
jgi:hypothetical protein